IGFTGGEPFMAPEMIGMLEETLRRGHSVLVLTNGMRPMMRPKVQDGLLRLAADHPGKLRLRVSLDHYAAEMHDEERGLGSFAGAMEGLRWIASVGLPVAIAGRTVWGEPEAQSRAGYAALIKDLGLAIDVDDPSQLVLFPEMKVDDEPPEISEACWGILNKSPNDIMCANQRMVVKRRGAKKASVLACTLLPYDRRFDLGESLAEATANPVPLNHKYCASFCVLGGGNCSA
ncbi:MAG: radical SAM protein, partial [Pseudomonadota bacterium]